MILPPIKVGFVDDEPSYCNSKNRPAFEAVGVVTVLVVVNESKTKAARESFVDSGVEENDRNDDSKCERIVVFPAPDSPLHQHRQPHFLRGVLILFIVVSGTHRNTMAWFSPRAPNLVHARLARSSASPIALPSLPPSGPLAEDV